MTGSTAPHSRAHIDQSLDERTIYGAAAISHEAFEDLASPQPLGSAFSNLPTTRIGLARDTQDVVPCQAPVVNRVDVSALDASRIDAEEIDRVGGEPPVSAGQTQLRGLVDDFHHRQRHASLVVAASVAASVALALCGLLLLLGANT